MLGLPRSLKLTVVSALSSAFSVVIAACYGPMYTYVTVAEGTVTDAGTGTGIPGIEVDCGANLAISDATGNIIVEFDETMLPADGSTVECTAKDTDGESNGVYQEKKASFVYTAGQVATLDIALDPAVESQ